MESLLSPSRSSSIWQQVRRICLITLPAPLVLVLLGGQLFMPPEASSTTVA